MAEVAEDTLPSIHTAFMDLWGYRKGYSYEAISYLEMKLSRTTYPGSTVLQELLQQLHITQQLSVDL